MKSIVFILFLIVLSLCTLNNAQKAEQLEAELEEREQDDVASDNDQIEYLGKYGYLNVPESKDPRVANVIPADAVEDAIKLFQRQVGIEITGKLDEETREHMRKKRCGNKDFGTIMKSFEENNRSGGRFKRYALYPIKWQRLQLTYHIANYPSAYQNDKHAVNEVFKKAFQIWSNEVPLNFKRVKDKMDLEIRFEKGWHNCTVEMTRNNSVLAHAFYPIENQTVARGIHFNDDLNWILDAPPMTKGSLLATAIHEIGHTLGMQHVEERGPKMSSVENWRQDLAPDDIAGIKSFYGEPSVLDSFYSLENKTIIADPRSSVYSKNALTIEECARYALNTNFNLTVWDTVEKKCHLKRMVEYEHATLYTNSGKPVAHRDLVGYDFTVSVALDDYKNWALNRECDVIVKLERDFGRRTQHTAYLCKRFPENSCCTILYRMDRNIQAHSIVEETIFKY